MRASREGITLVGAVAAAMAASACCFGPFLLAFVGFGGAAAAVALAPYRPYFLGLTLALLGGGVLLDLPPSRPAVRPGRSV